jgi:hypothetical protein
MCRCRVIIRFRFFHIMLSKQFFIQVGQRASEIQDAPVEDPLESKCSLYDKNKNRIPLRGSKCKALIKDLVADVEIQQRFVNNQENPIEAM